MKISYEFVTGEVSEVEVDERLGGMLLDLDRQQYNNDQKETRRHFSLNGLDYEGDLFAEGFSIVAEGLRGLAKAEGGTKDKAVKEQKQDTVKEQKQNAVQEQQENPATLEGIRALMAQKTQEGKSKEIKELLQKYGAAKLSAVKPEDYPALMQEAQVL